MKLRFFAESICEIDVVCGENLCGIEFPSLGIAGNLGGIEFPHWRLRGICVESSFLIGDCGEFGWNRVSSLGIAGNCVPVIGN